MNLDQLNEKLQNANKKLSEQENLNKQLTEQENKLKSHIETLTKSKFDFCLIQFMPLSPINVLNSKF